jgi:hypothetical protein
MTNVGNIPQAVAFQLRVLQATKVTDIESPAAANVPNDHGSHVRLSTLSLVHAMDATETRLEKDPYWLHS